MSFKIKIFKISCTFSWWHQDNVLNAGQSAPLGQATTHERILPRLQLFRRQLLPFGRTEAVTSMNCSQLLSSCHTRRMPKLRMFGWPHPAAPTDSNCTQLLLSGAACGCHQLLPRLEHHWCQHSNCEMSSMLSPSVCLLLFFWNKTNIVVRNYGIEKNLQLKYYFKIGFLHSGKMFALLTHLCVSSVRLRSSKLFLWPL